MNQTLRRLVLCLRVFLLISIMGAIPAVLPAQTKTPASPQSPADQNAADEIIQLYKEGIEAFDKGDFPTALKAFQTGFDKTRVFKKEVLMAPFLNNLGNVYNSLGQYEKALDFYRQSWTLNKKVGDEVDIARSLNNIGAVYDSLGQYDKAFDYHQQALALKVKFGSPENIAYSLYNIGRIYHNLGQYDKALSYHQQALALREKLDNQENIAASLSAIGGACNSLGQYDKALNYEQKALTLREKLDNQHSIAASLNNIAIVYDYLGQYDKALDCYQRALTINKKTDNLQRCANNLSNIGSVNYELGQYDKALDCHQKALVLNETLGSQQAVADSLNNIGFVYAARKQWDKAEDAYSRARRIFENMSQQVGDPTELAEFHQTLYHFYERYADVLAQQKREGEGLAMLEAGRAQGLARQIALNGSDYTAYFNADEKTLLKQRTTELTAASNLLHTAEAKLASAPAEQRAFFQKQKDEYQKQQADAEQKYTAYRDFLFAHYPQFREVSGERPPTVAELKSLARKNPDTLFLTWAILPDARTLLFALSDKTGLTTYTLPIGEQALATMAEAWRKALGAGNRGVEAANDPDDKAEEKQAKALYQALFAPLEKDGLMTPGRYARIVTVSTGPLLDIPFAALEDGNGKRLIETHTVSAAIALGIAFWRDNPAAPTSELLCVADPIGKAEPKPAATIALRREGWSELPGAREEGTQVAALFTKQSLLVGPAAKKADVLKAMTGAKFLHFATHGYLNDKNPFLSGLVLAPEAEGSGDDGVLSARDILNTPLAARIAVLSACETGRGKAVGGEGLQGLAWAFRAAGCPCVVASQWQVDDAATRDLMVGFYRNLLANQRKDDALQAAMLAIKAKKPSPFYWAAFQVIGDTAPLPKMEAKAP